MAKQNPSPEEIALVARIEQARVEAARASVSRAREEKALGDIAEAEARLAAIREAQARAEAERDGSAARDAAERASAARDLAEAEAELAAWLARRNAARDGLVEAFRGFENAAEEWLQATRRDALPRTAWTRARIAAKRVGGPPSAVLVAATRNAESMGHASRQQDIAEALRAIAHPPLGCTAAPPERGWIATYFGRIARDFAHAFGAHVDGAEWIAR